MIPDAMVSLFHDHQSLLWIVTVCFDLLITVLMYRIFGKSGLYAVIVLDVMLCNLQGPKLTTVFGMTTSLGLILYSGIYFATDLLGERYGRREANRAVLIGFAANVAMVALMSMSLLFLPTQIGGKATRLATDAHDALSFLFGFTPRFVFGSMLAYLISQTHDVWLFHWLKHKTQGRHLWLRNCLSTMVSQAIDTIIYSLVVWWAVLDLKTAIQLAGAKYVFKFIIALLDTPFIYWARSWDTQARDWNETDTTTYPSRNA
ncbi:MAG: queuosine precursor transporter [Verrucomicrobia bacterium]|nr:queuosine precursor transporter [Verrucomicrobiota bacterium]